MLDRLLLSLHEQIPLNIYKIIRIQLDNIKIFPYIIPQTAILELPQDQYHALSTISTYMGQNDGIKWPYYFITDSAGTEKSYTVNLIINILNQRNSNYLLLASIGIAAQNIGGKTIHSTLHLIPTQEFFYTQIFTDKNLYNYLKKIDTLILNKTSMVSAELLDFISETFARIHNNAIPFGGINVILVGDLVQLPPITGQTVFHATVWKLFYLLFLEIPQRQHTDNIFYQMLQEI